jgi:hypothetical protein
MSGINNISGSPATPIQHSPSPGPGPARLVIRTVDQARDHWRGITTLTQAAEAMEALDGQMEEGHIDEETYRQLSNTLMFVHSTLQVRATTQPATENLPVHPPVPRWHAPAQARGAHRPLASDNQVRSQLRNPDGTLRTVQEVTAALLSAGRGAGTVRIAQLLREATQEML